MFQALCWSVSIVFIAIFFEIGRDIYKYFKIKIKELWKKLS